MSLSTCRIHYTTSFLGPIKKIFSARTLLTAAAVDNCGEQPYQPYRRRRERSTVNGQRNRPKCAALDDVHAWKGVAVLPLPCTTAPADVPEQRPSLPRRNWQSILQTWRTRFSHVLLFAVKRVVDPLHGPVRGSREIVSAILKAIPTRNRKAIAAQLFLVSGSQSQVGGSKSTARTTKGLLRLKSGVTSDFRCLMGHVVQRRVNMAIASQC